MKKLLVALVACAPLLAQNIVGTWQGTLQIPSRELRTVFKISTTDADALKAVLYSIDQGGQPISANTVTRDGTSLKISILGIGGCRKELERLRQVESHPQGHALQSWRYARSCGRGGSRRRRLFRRNSLSERVPGCFTT